MCMVVGVLHPSLSVLATDSRWTFTRSHGPSLRRDLGGRLRAVPGGWSAWSGEGVLGLTALRGLESSVYCPGEAREWLPKLTDELAPQTIARYPSSDPRHGCLFTALESPDGRLSIAEIQTDGSGQDFVTRPGGDMLHVISWPERHDPPGTEDAMHQFRGALDRVQTPYDILRAVAGLFCFAAGHSDSMSREMEVGMTFRDGPLTHMKYLRAQAEWVARTGDLPMMLALQNRDEIPRAGIDLVEAIVLSGINPDLEVA